MSALASLRRRMPAPFQLLVLLALSIVPLLYAGALVDANLDPTGNLDRVPAAVVNADRGATVTSDGEQQDLDLGADLTQNLLDSEESSSFAWTEVSSEDAARGLADGSYYAVLSIPPEFSADVVSAMTVDGGAASDARQAGLTLTTDDATSYVAGTAARSIGQALEEEVRTGIGEQYLSAVYLGLADLHDAVGDAASGASDLADGATSLADGAADLDAGAADVATGASDAATGADTLASGLQQLSTGASSLPSGLAAASDGATQASSGATELSAGLQTLSTGTADLDAGAQDALAGATTLSGGLDTLAASTPGLSDGADDVAAGLQQLLEGYAGLSDAERLAALSALADGAGQVAAGADEVDGSVGQLAAGAQQLVGDDGSGLTALAGGADAVAAGTADAADGAADLDAGLETLASELGDAAAQAPALASGLDDAASGATDLSTGLADLDDGTQQLLSGADDLASGAADLDDGASRLRGELAEGVDDVPTFTDAEATELSEVAGDPVTLQAERDHEVSGYGAGLAPYFLALGLWVGAMAIFFMRPAVTDELLARRLPAPVAALRAYLPTLGLALAQSLIAALVVDLALGLDAANLAALVGIAVLTSITFTALNQGLVALIGPIGRFVALLMTVMQLTSAGGTYPIETAPRVFGILHDVLPLPYALQAMRSAIAGGDLGLGRAVVVLGAWFLLGLVLLLAGVARASHRSLDTLDGPDDIRAGRPTVDAPTDGTDETLTADPVIAAHGDDAEATPAPEDIDEIALPRPEPEPDAEPEPESEPAVEPGDETPAGRTEPPTAGPRHALA